MLCTSICLRIILTLPNSIGPPENLRELPRVPHDDGGPVFAEPWQALVFALAVRLSSEGAFTWVEWTQALGEELKTASSSGDPDDGSHYYDHWLAALERLVVTKGLSDPAALAACKDAWAEAYARTPHGKPVELLH